MKKIHILLLAFILASPILMSQTDFYDVLPDLNTCNEGKLKEDEKQNVLKEINTIRALHGLKPVTYNYSKDINVQKSALITAANEMLSHTPANSVKCFTQQGYDGASTSNLYIKWAYGTSYPATVTSVFGWMVDNNVNECGHRRWIIDPFLKSIAIGRVDLPSVKNPQFTVTGMSLFVIDNDKQNLSDWKGDFVAYPYQNYPTNYAFDASSGKPWFFSFTAIFDKTNYWNNQKVDFSQATLDIKDESNNTVAYTEMGYQNDGYAVPNLLKWKISNAAQDMKYTVTIKNVIYNGNKKDFTYWFKITDQVGNSPDTPILSGPANSTKDVDANVKLTWNASNFADNYSLQLAKENTFANPIVDEPELSATNYTTSNLEELTQYFWRVKANNSIGSSSWSEIRSFTTKALPPKKPVLTGPVNNAGYVALDVTLQWDAVTKATSYHVQVADGDKFNSFGLYADQQNVPTNSYKIPANTLKTDSKYYWHVRAKNTIGFGDWSDTYYFSTGAPTSVTDELTSDVIAVQPNPVSGIANLTLNLEKDGRVSIDIYSSNGERIKSLLNNENYISGTYILNLYTDEMPQGIYYLKLLINGKSITKAISVVK